MNKKANSFHFWIELIIFIGLFLVILGIMGYEMNDKYGKDYDLTLGLNLTSSIDSLNDYSEDLINSTTEGQTSVTDYGILKITTVPSIIIQATRILWSFISGGFIYKLVMAMQLGSYGSAIARLFQMLYVVVISFILIKLVLRINV